MKKTDGIPIDPKLPARFDDTPNDERPESHQKWWHQPYIETYTWERMSSGARGPANATEETRAAWFEQWRQEWLKTWPSGTRYDVRCLDGGAWDRSTSWGMFATLEEAVACAKEGPAWSVRGGQEHEK
jgi:hypothetical protein